MTFCHGFSLSLSLSLSLSAGFEILSFWLGYPLFRIPPWQLPPALCRRLSPFFSSSPSFLADVLIYISWRHNGRGQLVKNDMKYP